MRCFLALLPDAAAREACQALQPELAAPGARPVSPDNLHITLVFLGQCDAERLEALSRRCDELPSFDAFTLNIDRAGWWPKPRVAWLGPSHSPPALLRLERSLRELALDLGFAPEERPYRPHVTLLRKQRREPDFPAFAGFAWPAREFCLMQSLGTEDGVEYRVLRRWPLR